MKDLDHSQLMAQGVSALREGRAADARQLFERLVASHPNDPVHHLALGYACMALHDDAIAEACADSALRLSSQDLQALSMKAEILLRQDRQGAVDYFQGVLKAASAQTDLPDSHRALVKRATEITDAFRVAASQQLRRHVQTLLTERRLAAGPRFDESLDLLCGERTLFLPAPRLYYFPGLPAVPFHDTAGLSWVAEVEAATPTIRAELLGLLADPAAPVVPYLRSDPARPQLRADPLVGSVKWGAVFLWKDGVPVDDVLLRCPCTSKLLQKIPLVRTPGRSPNVLFSILQPGAHIAPHHGFINTRLIGHLPLIVPEACGLRVGGATHTWKEGRVVLFDDTIEHEAWNRSNKPRAVMIFEVWRPELSATECRAVDALFEAIDRVRARPRDWGI